MAQLLSIEDLTLSFCSGRKNDECIPILHNICFSIDAGTTHALVGESGSGKSVTALSILRLLEETSSVQTSGKIIFESKDILSMNKEQVRALRGNRIAMIFQEPMTSLNPVYTIGDQLMEPILLHQKTSKREALQRAMQLLERTGINDPEYRIHSYPHQLSGGQRQRVMIAMALACRPSLLIADEPTTALDVTIENQILELIRDIQQELGTAVLMITHDLHLVKRIADTISIMQNGHVVEQGKTKEVFESPSSSYTKRLMAASYGDTKKSTTAGPELLTVKNLSCSFTLKRGGIRFLPLKRTSTELKALDNLSLIIRQGMTLGVVGESGSGKSTLGLCLLNLAHYQGSIVYHTPEIDISLSSLSRKKMIPLRRELQIVFQDPFSSLSPRFSVEQIIGEGLRAHRIGTADEQRRMIDNTLAEVELDPSFRNRFPHEFSGGQRQRIAIARAIILRPKLLILDEPTSALDVTIQAQIIGLLKRLQKKLGMTYIFITHDLRVVRSLADELVVMRNGQIVESGPAEKLFENPQETYTRNLLQTVFQ